MVLLVQKFDRQIILFIYKYLKNKYLDVLMFVMTKLGNLGAVWIMMSFYLLINRQYRHEGKVVLITLITGAIIGEGMLKNMIRRPRPFNEIKNLKIIIAKPSSYSFPSGHTLSSFAAANVLSKYFTEYELIFMGLAFLISISRVYLCVHYPTDIIAGIVIGMMLSKVIMIFF